MISTFGIYKGAFGSKFEKFNWDVYYKVWGVKITISSGSIRTTNKWLRVTDNGYTTGNNGWEPYWRNDSFVSLDLQYGVYRLF